MSDSIWWIMISRWSLIMTCLKVMYTFRSIRSDDIQSRLYRYLPPDRIERHQSLKDVIVIADDLRKEDHEDIRSI